MIRICIANICAYNFVPSIAFEAVLNVGRAKTPQCLTGHNAKEQIIPAARILGPFSCPHWHIVWILIRNSVADDHAVNLIS